MQAAILVGATVVLLNAAFYFLSGLYFADQRADLMAAPISDAHIQGVRLAFGLFTVVVGVAIVGVIAQPKWVAHGIATAIGLASVAAALGAFGTSIPMVLPIALLVIGALFPTLAWGSLKGSRPAWAFLASLCVVYALVTFFGATKVRVQLDISLWTSLILPGLLVAATIGFTLIRRDYREIQ